MDGSNKHRTLKQETGVQTDVLFFSYVRDCCHMFVMCF